MPENKNAVIIVVNYAYATSLAQFEKASPFLIAGWRPIIRHETLHLERFASSVIGVAI